MLTRNQPCPCGSGRRYKHCHGRPAAATPPGAEQRIEAALRRFAAERLQQRRLQRSGRPIVSWSDEGGRYVAVDRRVFCGPWRTFVDFLGHYIGRVLGGDWGNAELSKPRRSRHPLLNWYEDYRRQQMAGAQVTGELHPAEPTGVAAAYLRLAYDLYTLEHDGDRLGGADVRERLIARLKRAAAFTAARHEIRVVAMLLRAGFTLQWNPQSHDDFNAVHPDTRRALQVRCRIRRATMRKPHARLGRYAGLVRDALGASDPFPLLCIDLNAPRRRGVDWRTWAVDRARGLETDAALPPAYLLITDFHDHHHAEATGADEDVVLEGFRIDELRHGRRSTLKDALAARRAHPEVHDLLASIREHRRIPVAFGHDGHDGGALPERPRIGHPHTLSDGRRGVVVSAVVKEPEPLAVLLMAFDDGRRRFCEVPLSDDEMAAWRRYPETFFGDLRIPPPHCRDALDCYDFFEDAYRDQPREQLIAWMARWPQPERRRTMTQPQLLDHWCSVLAERAVAAMQ